MNIIEALLFVSGDSISCKDIAEKLAVTEKEVLESAKELQKLYTEERGIQLLIFNKKLQLCSNKEYSDAVSSVLNPIKERELSRSMLEVAAIIAYKQPVTRLDLEELRGANSEFAIQNLLKLGVIEIVGRKDTVGKPVLFGTTDEFLKRFQISSLEELPDYDMLMEKIAELRSEQSSYLFHKEEYVEEGEVGDITDATQQVFDEVAITESTETLSEQDKEQEETPTQAEETPIQTDETPASSGAISSTDDEDFELKDIKDEEVPDFLKGEDVTIIE